MSLTPAPSQPQRPSPEAAGTLIAELYERHGRSVLGLCRLLLRDPTDAEDATQSAFLAAHGALLRGSVPRDGGAWITQIARNECRARIRERMQAPLDAGEEALLALPAADADPAERQRDESVRQALAALPQRQRHAVVLHDVFGLRAREVATALGLSLTAVEALLFRARRQLRVRLRPVAGAITLPAAIRDTLAAALPGFSDGGGATGAVAAGGGIAGGIVAKLAAAPVAAKVTAAAVAVTATGSLVAVEASRDPDPTPAPVVSTVSSDDGTRSSGRSDDDSANGASSGPGSDDSGRRGGGDDRASEDRSGRGSEETVTETEAERKGEGGADDGRTGGQSGTGATSSGPSSSSGPSPSSGSSPSGRSGESDHAAVDDSAGSSGPGSESSTPDDDAVETTSDDRSRASSSGRGGGDD